jgi:tRNA (cytidine56-2'-O)-methyltransferase
MYGEPLDAVLPKIPPGEDLLLVVGATKVPRDVYDLATFNVAVGNQPHSEVAALAVFLDRFLAGKELWRTFAGRIGIVPSKRGKTVVESESSPRKR